MREGKRGEKEKNSSEIYDAEETAVTEGGCGSRSSSSGLHEGGTGIPVCWCLSVRSVI